MCRSNGGLTVPKDFTVTVLFKSELFKDSLLYNIQCTFNDSIRTIIFFCNFSFKLLILGILIIQNFFFLSRMYDVDGNGVIDQDEMTKIVQAIYDMLGAGATKPTDSAEERAKNIFSRMDENGDGHLTEEEFLRGCLQDDELSKMLAPNVVQ